MRFKGTIARNRSPDISLYDPWIPLKCPKWVREVKGIKYGTCVLRVGVMTRPNLKWITAINLESNLQLTCTPLTDTVCGTLNHHVVSWSIFSWPVLKNDWNILIVLWQCYKLRVEQPAGLIEMEISKIQ